MPKYASKTSGKRGGTSARAVAKKKGIGTSGSQIEDNRPESVMRRNLQAMADASPQASQLKSFQLMANGQPDTQTLVRMQAIANADAGKSETAQRQLEGDRSPIQARWIDKGRGGDLEWDQLIDGVQWFANADGKMYYLIRERDQIKLGNVDEYEALQDRPMDHSFWVAHNVAGFDILGHLDASVVDEEEADVGVLNTESLEPFPTASQFKDIFKVGGRLLSVFKTGDSSGVLNEVATLHKIGSVGHATPNPEVVDVIYKGKKTLGVLMDKVEGVFVDVAKLSNFELVGYIINEAAGGRSANVTEAGIFQEMIRMRRGERSEVRREVLETLLADLRRMLATQDEMAINDLQFVVQPDGRAVIIDPQWAGRKSTLTNPGEIRLIRETYQKIESAIADLSGEQQPRRPRTLADRLRPSGGRFGPGSSGPPSGDMRFFT